MTEDELKQIEERVNKATPGPWDRNPRNNNYSTCVVIETSRLAVVNCYSTSDTQFIAHARTDIPALIAEVRRLRLRLNQRQWSVISLIKKETD